MNILVAADGSDYTKRMLAWLAVHDEWFGPTQHYTVVHCAPALPALAAAAVDRATLQAWHAEESEQVFKPIRIFFDHHGLKARFVAHVGDPAEVITSLTQRERFDLLLMGSHGHSALAGLVLGSVATRVLALCKTPLLLVR